MTACLLLLAVLGVPGSAADPAAASPYVRSRWIMGTRLTLTVHAEDEARARRAVEAAFAAVGHEDAVLSTWRADSDLARLNAAAGRGRVEVAPRLSRLLALASDRARATGGAFDATVGPLVDAWDLRGTGRVPSGRELSRARALVGADVLALDPRAREAELPAGAWIDSGGFGKGTALDRAARVLLDHGVESALLDFGGQLLALGPPPGRSAWTVSVAHPLDRDAPALDVELVHASLATSAQSERFVALGRAGGRRIGHVLDPRSGRPARADRSASVLSASAADADALSTALLVMGDCEARRYLRDRPDLAGARMTARGRHVRLDATESFLRHVSASGVAR